MRNDISDYFIRIKYNKKGYLYVSVSKMDFKPKLYYFNMKGRAECIRILLNHAKVEFEDIRFEQSEWPQHKDKFEFKQVPALQIDESTTLTQTQAILSYLGSKYGYSRTEPKEVYELINVAEALGDFAMKLVPLVYSNETEEKKKEMAKALAENEIPFFFGIFEKKLNANVSKDFFVGDKLSTVDFQMASFINGLILGRLNELCAPILKNYPSLEGYATKWGKEFWP